MYFWENEKVILRMVDSSDASVFEEHLKDTVGRMQSDHGIALPSTPQTAADMVNYALEGIDEGEELWFAIMNHEEEMVGYAVIDWMNERMANTQININIFEGFRRCGYATSAAGILMEYVFHERRFHKLGCCVLEGNEAGNEFVKSIGFSLDGFRSEMFYTNGRYVGEYYYSILEDEFEAGIRRRDNYAIPDSDIGRTDIPADKPVRPGMNGSYFWNYDGIILRDMTEENYIKNHEMIYDTQSCVFFDSDVKLPKFEEELSDHEKAHLNFNCDDDRIEFAVCNEEGEYVGCINVCGLDRKNGKFSYSNYTLKAHRGKGYATKALRLILWYCFMELRMHKMICCVNDENNGSAAVMRKVGCHVEGVMRDNEYYHGKFVDAVMFGISKEEFMKFNGFHGEWNE